jgi:uncharacterized membrane protein
VTSAPRITNHLEVIEIGRDTGQLNDMIQLIDINNAGQVLGYVLGPVAANDTTAAVWDAGVVTQLALQPGQQHAFANAISESGVVSGEADKLATFWLTPTNAVNVTYADGSHPNFPNGFGVGDVSDSDDGLIGVVAKYNGAALGTPPVPEIYRLSGTHIPFAPIRPQGIPAGYEFRGANRVNRNGIIVGRADKIDETQNVLESSLAITINARDEATVLPLILSTPTPATGGLAINDAGDIVGAYQQLLGESYSTAVLWRNGTVTSLWAGEGAKATAINNRGHVAVFRSPTDTERNGAAIWSNGRIVTLLQLFGTNSDRTGFGAIAGMNDNGWIICQAAYKQEGERSVLIKLAPVIREQPVSRTKVPGQSVNFSVGSYAIGDITYHWRKNGANLLNGTRISGADTPSLTINPTEAGDAGSYDLVITDSYGMVVSSNAVLTVFSQGCFPPPAGLVAHWTGDGTSAEVFNRHTATLVNDTTFGTGFLNQAFRLDGLDDFVTTDLDISSNTMPVTTWEAWVFPTRVFHTKYQMIFSDPYNYRGVGIDPGTDEFTVYTGRSPGFGRVAKVSTNEWQHVVVSFSPTGAEFFKNGQRFDLGFVPPPPPVPSNAVLTIGNTPFFGHQYFFQGSLDEISIYNRQLSPAEVQAIYDVGAGGKCHDLPLSLNQIRIVSLGSSNMFMVSRATPGQWCVLERSKDLIAWTPIAIVHSPGAGIFEVRDPNPPPDRAFYRLGLGVELHRASISVSESSVSLTLWGTPGKRYVLQRSPDLAAWATIMDLYAPVSGSVLLNDPNPPRDKAFYRIVMENFP